MPKLSGCTKFAC